MKSKFEIKDTRTFSEKAKSFIQSAMFWKGRSKGIIYTRNIRFDDFRYIFFPKGFEKYGYLGTQIWNEDGSYFKALYPLVLALDYEAKPKWYPRWFLRFLHVFGMDKSIVRVRNRRLSNLLSRLTKGIALVDWKTKWEDYDLRISIHAPKHLQDLANDIEHGYYSRGRQTEIVEAIKAIDPNASIIWGSIDRLVKQLEELENNMIGGVQPKILLTQDENGNLKIDEEMGKLLFGEPKINWKLVRERDGLTKQSNDIKWIGWNEDGSFKEKFNEIAINRSLIMSPFSESFTWQTTNVTEIIEEREDYIKFKTQNSNYELFKTK